MIGLAFATNHDAIRLNSANFWEPSTINNGKPVPLAGFALIAAIGMAMVGSLFSADAWNNITFTAGEVINPRKNIPRSLALGTLTVTVLYLLTNAVYLTALPILGDPKGDDVFSRGIQFALQDRLGTAAIYGLFGNSAMIIMASLIVISTFGCNNGLILSGARVNYAMAKEQLFFRNVGNLNSKGVPANGLILQCIWASLLCLSGTYGDLLDYVVFSVLIFYVLTIFGIFRLRIKRPEMERPYKAFGYPVIPAIYILSALLIMGILLFYKPDFTLRGLAIVLVGIPVYFLWLKRKPEKS